MKQKINTLKDIEKEKIRLRKLIALDQQDLETQLFQSSEQIPNYFFSRWLLPLGAGSLLTLGIKQLTKPSTPLQASSAAAPESTWRAWLLSLIMPSLTRWANEQLHRFLNFQNEDSFEEE